MKTFLKLLCAIVALLITRPASALDTPTNAPAKLAPVRSVFVVPSNVREGRDPFFPESTRTIEAAAAATTKTVEISALAIKGFSGTTTHRLVIINNHTFGVGDEGDVLTTTGRVHIKCIEIHPDLVAIEISGRRHELHVSAP